MPKRRHWSSRAGGGRKRELDEGFRNHGERVNFYKELARALDLPNHFGSMWANFGDPVESGVLDLQAQLAAAQGDPDALADAEADLAEAELSRDEAQAEVDRLAQVVQEADAALAELGDEATDEDIAAAQAALNAAQAEQEQAQTDLADAEGAFADAENALAEAEGDPDNVSDLEAALEAAITAAKPGNGPKSGWETEDIDLNDDGFIDEEDLALATGTSAPSGEDEATVGE